jgi:protein TonB
LKKIYKNIFTHFMMIIVANTVLSSCQTSPSNKTKVENKNKAEAEDTNATIEKNTLVDSLKKSKKDEFVKGGTEYIGHEDLDETSDPTTNEKMPVALPEKEKQPAQTEVYDFVEKMPEFPGGTAEMMKYIKNNLQYPNEALQRNLEGIVYIKFIVHENGTLSDFKILKTPDKVFNQPALAVLHHMPNWIPGEKNGEKVKVYMTIPIRFKYDK